MRSRWREAARSIIKGMVVTTGTKNMKLLKKELRDAYPFGERAMHPYKIWCDEIKKQLQQLNPKQSTTISKRQLPLF